MFAGGTAGACQTAFNTWKAGNPNAEIINGPFYLEDVNAAQYWVTLEFKTAVSANWSFTGGGAAACITAFNTWKTGNPNAEIVLGPCYCQDQNAGQYSVTLEFLP